MLRLHPFEYHRPERLEEALELLGRHAGDAMPIAGGTDLVPNMKHRLFTPGHLVSLRGIAELRGIAVEPDPAGGPDAATAPDDAPHGRAAPEEAGGPGAAAGSTRIGATESLDRVFRSELVRGRHPSLARACRLISGPQLRRMGTLGGNVCLDTRCTYYNQTRFWRKSLGFCLKKEGDVCHVVKGGTRCVAAHSADAATALMTLEAELELAGPEGRRRIGIDRFFTSDGIWNRRMERDEILVAVRLPAPRPGTRFGFEKLRVRGAIDFPLLNLAVAVREDPEGRIESLRMVASGMGSYPRRIGKVEEAAVGNPLTGSVIEAIAEQAFRQCHPLDNIPVDPEWRRAMAPVLVRRTLGSLTPAGPAA